MSRLINFCCLLSLCIIVSACGGDDPSPTNSTPPTTQPPPDDGSGNTGSSIEGCQYPMFDILDNGSFDITQGEFRTLDGSTDVYQAFGFVFHTAFNGQIKELGILVPEVNSYTVRIYPADLSDNTLLVETTISQNGTEWVYKSIDPLSIEADKSYLVAIYFQSKADEQKTYFYNISAFTYPVVTGDITVEGYAVNSFKGELGKPEPKDPDLFTLMNGFVDFCFEAE